ncbi:MAG: MFS transporter [Micromonosporaceae bacterium]|jgi:EmrB/QacA subfamily drug resistance transporter|nr:MFS transporter [Micromonosporaceae bacterium]
MTRDATRGRMPHRGILAMLAMAEFTLTLDLSIVNIALPAIQRELGFGAGSLPWVVNGYALTFGGFLLLGGRAADLFGGRRVFSCALAGFTLASLGCALAPVPVALVAARIGQGLAAGVLAPTTLSILTATYRVPAQRNRALAIWTAVAIGGGAAGGLVGGVLTAASWRLIFLVNVPLGAALLGYALSRLPRASGRASRERLDVAGAATATAGLTALVWALVRAEAAGWTAPDVLAGIVAAALLLVAFALIEVRLASAPVVPLPVFASRPVAVGNLLNFLSFVPVMATWYLLSLDVQNTRGYPPAEAGLWFLPVSLAVVGGSQISFRLIDRLDARVLFAAGALVGAAGLAGLAVLPTTAPVGWQIGAACLAMTGGGLMVAPITVAVTSGVGPEQGGLASGLLNTTRQVGGAFGLAILGPLGPTAFGAGAAILTIAAAVGVLTLPTRLAPAAEPTRTSSPPGGSTREAAVPAAGSDPSGRVEAGR